MLDETLLVRRENEIITKQEKELTIDRLFSKFNKVFVSGRIEAEPTYSHEVFGNKFYKTRIRVKRISETEDLVPIIISDLLIKKAQMEGSLEGKWVKVAGQFKSHNKMGEDGRRHLNVFLFVKAIKIYENKDELEETINTNLIYLNGHICKPPVYRVTPLKRKITDLIIKVNRSYGKPDYIPCIAWGTTAKWAKDLEVGNQVEIYGRVQSREYFKRYSPDSKTGEYKETYEISILKIKKVENLEEQHLKIED